MQMQSTMIILKHHEMKCINTTMHAEMYNKSAAPCQIIKSLRIAYFIAEDRRAELPIL